LKAKVVDIETAFLHGDLKETIYMEIPRGMEASTDECLMLNKTIYGLVQSNREFYNNLVLCFSVDLGVSNWLILIDRLEV
jgi:Reverse transcriptase (RNA-dependent DNA polymerase)